MAEHEVTITAVTAKSIRERMENRFAFLHDHDRYNGKDAGEYNILERVLADSFREEEPEVKEGNQLLENSAISLAADNGQSAGSRPASRCCSFSPAANRGGHVPTLQNPRH